MIDSIISIQQLAKKFGSFQAISDINIQVNRGDVYGFLGPNGAGKSTTLKCITGLLPSRSGSIAQQRKSSLTRRASASV
jgi:ABC-2 type transport system ATP-binding protein